MKVEFDLAKSAKNSEERGLPFDLAHDFDWQNADYIEDTRHEYPEHRFIAIGFLYDRLHVLCFTPIFGGVRVISFRKANQREIKRYETTYRP